MRRLELGTVVVAVMLVGCGCAALRSPETKINFAADRFESVAILYRLNPRPTTGPNPGTTAQPATPSESSHPTPAEGVVQTLAVQYPHPDGRKGYARVELVVERPAAPDAAGKESSADWLGVFSRAARDWLPGISLGDNILAARALDLPVYQLCPIVERLQSDGFFSEATASSSNVRVGLSARINGVCAERQWSRVPELDALLKRVQAKGKIVSHSQPAGESPKLSPASSAALNLAARSAPERLPRVELPR